MAPVACANQRAILISDANVPACLPSNGYMDAATTSTICFLCLRNVPEARADPGSNAWERSCMTASGRPPNQLLQMLDAAEFDLLRPHLATVEMVRESVLGEAGAALRHVYFPHGGSVSISVSLSDGQTIEVAMLGRDSVIGGGAALADGIAPADAIVLFPGTASTLEITAFRAIAASSLPFRGLIMRHEQVLLAHAQQSLLCNTM